MASVYKFTYFDYMGVGESIRYLMTYGGVRYENVVVNHITSWPTIKQNVPFGKLPLLEFEGKAIYQPMAIARFFGKKFNLLGADDVTNGQIDALAETINEFYYKVSAWYRESDAPRKMQLKRTLDTEIVPIYLSRMDKMVETNSGYFFGKLTWVDFWFVGVMESVMGMWGIDFLQGKYVNLYQLMHKIHALPAIKIYISQRPEYDY